MNKDMLDTFAAWGDRSNRDTAHLLDLVVAGTIEQTIGHGTVLLRPVRLEEIADRIGPRERDVDGGWRVTLLPAGGSSHDRAPFAREVLDYIDENPTSCMEDDEDDAFIASFIRAAAKPGVTLADLGMAGFAMFVEWVDERQEPTEGTTMREPEDVEVNTERTSAEVASLAAKALSMTRADLSAMPDGDVLSMLKRLAGSALTQRG